MVISKPLVFARTKLMAEKRSEFNLVGPPLLLDETKAKEDV